MSIKKQQRCNIASTAVGLMFCLLLGAASFMAVSAIANEWRAADYWLAWFSGFALLGSVVSALWAGVSLATALDCGPGE